LGRQSQIGLDGELECARQLSARGWTVTDLNASQKNIPNVDLLIEKPARRHAIQVKTSIKPRGYITGGSVNHKVVHGAPIFNRVPEILSSSFVIFLARKNEIWRFFVVPIELAENLFRRNIDAYFGRPRLDGLAKQPTGQADIFIGEGVFPHSRIVPDQRAEILPYETRWELLE
jgi:Holliday junction resolvase